MGKIIHSVIKADGKSLFQVWAGDRQCKDGRILQAKASKLV